MDPIITEQDEDGEWVIADEQLGGEEELLDRLVEDETEDHDTKKER